MFKGVGYFASCTAQKIIPKITYTIFSKLPRRISFLSPQQKHTLVPVSSLKTMKINSPQFQSIFTPELNTLIELFEKYNYELRIAGGAVRDLLMGKTPRDLDFATIATPAEMKALFEAESIRMLNKKGEGHGTITCRINDKVLIAAVMMLMKIVCGLLSKSMRMKGMFAAGKFWSDNTEDWCGHRWSTCWSGVHKGLAIGCTP